MEKSGSHSDPFGLDVIHRIQTEFPIPRVASTWTFDCRESFGEWRAMEAAADGILLTFSPMVDIARDARGGDGGRRGEDPVLGSADGSTYLGIRLALDAPTALRWSSFAHAQPSRRDLNSTEPRHTAAAYMPEPRTGSSPAFRHPPPSALPRRCPPSAENVQRIAVPPPLHRATRELSLQSKGPQVESNPSEWETPS